VLLKSAQNKTGTTIGRKTTNSKSYPDLRKSTLKNDAKLTTENGKAPIYSGNSDTVKVKDVVEGIISTDSHSSSPETSVSQNPQNLGEIWL